MHKSRFFAKNLRKRGIINLQRQLGILSLRVGRVFLVGGLESLSLLRKSGERHKCRRTGCDYFTMCTLPVWRG